MQGTIYIICKFILSLYSISTVNREQEMDRVSFQLLIIIASFIINSLLTIII